MSDFERSSVEHEELRQLRSLWSEDAQSVTWMGTDEQCRRYNDLMVKLHAGRGGLNPQDAS